MNAMDRLTLDPLPPLPDESLLHGPPPQAGSGGASSSNGNGSSHSHAVQPVGAILVQSGRLRPGDVERIVQHQRQRGLSFGAAALSLKLLKRQDIDRALSTQFDYPYLRADNTDVGREVVLAFHPFSHIGEHIRALRSQLMLRWFNGEARRQSLVVVSPSRGEGRSFIAANLAVAFAQQGDNTLLIDADLRHPRLSSWFGVRQGPGLSGVLARRAGMDAIVPVPGLPRLSVLSAGVQVPNPQELLGRPTMGQLLRAAGALYDVILIDSPASTACADAEILAARAGAALLVNRRDQTRLADASALARRLQQLDVAVVGTVLNE